MVYRSQVFAFLLAVTIAAVTTLFLSLIEGINTSALALTFIISLSAAYLTIYIVLEFLVFREINRIYKLLEKLKKKELGSISRPKNKVMNPIRGINEDIFSFAELKQREIDELRKLEVFRREFIADVSHELKTPLFAAQGFVHTLLDGAVNDKAVRIKFLKKAAKSLDGLDALVQDLLTLSHIETGQIKMHVGPLNLVNLTREVFEQFEDKADKRHVKLRIDGNPGQVLAMGDWQRIGQVLTNLISNAIKHSEEGGEVVVSFEVGRKNIITRVKDFGEGIAAEHLGRIFERFYRVDKSRSREKGGTGLGLAIVKHILESHNSRPEVESAPGKGSTFSFKLRRAVESDT